jgi:hypothetical protein
MSDEARLQRWLASQRSGPGDGLSSEHIDTDTLSRHAAGKLGAARARAVNEHLQVCDDGRCPAFVHEQLAAQAQVVDEASAPTITGAKHGMIDGRTTRTFQCREIVWSTFESLARERGAPIDELVNAAMQAYAVARGFAPLPASVAPSSPTMTRPEPRIEDKPPIHDPLAETNDEGVSALDRAYERDIHVEPRHGTDWDDDLARTSAREKMSREPLSKGPPSSVGPESRTTPRRLAASKSSETVSVDSAPVTHRMPGAPPRTSPATKRLVLTYDGRAFPVDKERFLIGRSTTQSDLRLDDPNVSRQHAVIEKVGSAWYVVDLGSTNGVHVGGERITRRAIGDGDVITIISHQIQCAVR